MSSSNRSFFISKATQRELINEDLPNTELEIDGQIIQTVPVRLRLFKLTASGSRWIGAQRDITYDGEPILVCGIRENFYYSLIKSRRLARVVATILSTMGIPDNEQPAVLRKLLKLAKVAVPGVPIVVIIVDVTLHLAPSTAAMVDLFRFITSYGGINYQMIIDSVAWEYMETYGWQIKCIPAAKSYIEGLEKVRLDSLEEASPCVICMEDLDHFDADVQQEEKGIDQDHQNITRLPCSHLYHRDCAVQWLEINHFCPLCHHRMPVEEAPAAKARTVEAGELPKPSWKDHWRLLLMMSHRVITVTLVCRSLRNVNVDKNICQTQLMELIAFFCAYCL